MIKNFIVYAPGPYAVWGGGSIALHKLCHNICSLGEQCFIVTDSKNPNYLGTQITLEQGIEMAKYGQSMVIYPEVTVGNPLQSPHVTRWILYFVRETGEHGKWGANDLIYKYASIYTQREGYENPVTGMLTAFELNLDLFKDKGWSRQGSCYIKKKNPDKADIHPEGSFRIDGANGIPQDETYLKTLSDVFNRYETFYAYDDATWLSVMAALCGCKSIVVPGKYSAVDWYDGYPYFGKGIQYGFEQYEIDYAENTKGEVRNHLLTLEAESIEQTRSFINTAKGL